VQLFASIAERENNSSPSKIDRQRRQIASVIIACSIDAEFHFAPSSSLTVLGSLVRPLSSMLPLSASVFLSRVRVASAWLSFACHTAELSRCGGEAAGDIHWIGARGACACAWQHRRAYDPQFSGINGCMARCRPGKVGCGESRHCLSVTSACCTWGAAEPSSASSGEYCHVEACACSAISDWQAFGSSRGRG